MVSIHKTVSPTPILIFPYIAQLNYYLIIAYPLQDEGVLWEIGTMVQVT